ncbi:MAG: peptidyl-prolyl cis-trans isomerase, partial [Gammaproteobacteria bacterium]|nr:peptidyl-prolyl cis-trans isomerase [Gammaproteobacteria bacterium]
VGQMGYRVGDEQVGTHIRSLPVFQVAGQFSRDGYLATLASQGVSPAAFEEERRAALQVEELQAGVLESAFFTPAEFRRFITLEGERREVSVAMLDVSLVSDDVQVGEDDLKQFYESNPGRFESVESVALDFVEARAADLPAATEPSEADLRAIYDENPGRFRTEEQRRARHILIAVDQDRNEAAAAALAAQIKERLTAGEDFAALARELSNDAGSAPSGGDLGWAGRGTFVEAFENALFGLSAGEISEPVKTEFGYHLIQLTELRPGAEKSFEQVRDQLAEEARSTSVQDAFYALTEKMDDAALENPESLQAVAAASGLPVKHIDSFTRAGGGPFGSNRAVINAAFSAALIEGGENSPIVEIEDGHVVFLRVTEHRPVKLRPFDEVREEVEALVRAERAAGLVAERGNALLDRVRAGGDLAALAAAERANFRGPQVVSRVSQDLPEDVVSAVFRAPRPQGEGNVYGGVQMADGGFAVFAVHKVTSGRPDDIPRDQRDARKNILARQAGVAEVTALAVDLRNSASVVIAPGLLEQPTF